MLMRILTLLVALPMLGLPVGVSALLIDDFSSVQGPSTIPTGGGNPATSADGLAATSVGGARVIELERTVGFGSAEIDVSLTEAGVLSMNTAAGVKANGGILYDGGTDTTLDPNGLNVDVTDGGTSNVLQVIARSDLPATIRVSFYEGGNVAYADVSLSGNGTDNPFEIINIPFASFLGSADLTNVGAITVEMSSARTSLDMQIARIETVPEAATLLLLGAGLIGIVSHGRSRS